jgi:hypothetical protein
MLWGLAADAARLCRSAALLNVFSVALRYISRAAA